MTPKGKVIHRQQFQNAQQIIEVTVKNKPKVKLIKSTINNKNSKPFVRDCVLKNELEKLVKEEEEKRLKIKAKKMNPDRPMPKLKINHPKTALEIQKKIKKKKKEKKNHEFLPPGMSWAECLQNISSSRTSASENSANDNLEINNEDVQRKQKRAAEKIKHISQNQKYQTKISKPQRNRLENMDHMDNPLHPNLENLTNKLTKLCKPALINKAIQTSLISITKVPPLDLPDSQKSVPVSKLSKSHNQTHSPFGESAIRLLNHLRERLRSKGDSEGSEIVNALEAYFGSAESRANENRVDIGDSASPVFPISIPKPDTVTPTFEKDKLEKIIAEQERKLNEQEDNIEKLKSFSKGVIDYHGELLNLITGSSSNAQNRHNAMVDGKHIKSSDSGIDLNHSDDLKMKVRALLEEKEQLEKTVKEQKYDKERLEKIINDQKNSIMRLELEFHQFKKDHQYDYNNRRPASANGRLLYRNERPSSREKGVSSSRNTDAALLCHTPNVSDENVDSAFEERSSKSVSRPSSNSTCNKHFVNEVNPFEKAKERLDILFPPKFNYKEASLSTQDPDSLSTTADTVAQVCLEGDPALIFSETLVQNTPDVYLESTHLNNRNTQHEFNGRDVGNIHRAGFPAMNVSSFNESHTLVPITEMNESETLMPVTEL
ncbi:UNVERIFIED_CONTAM: hypothetical protein RMT77_002430 [Armadillidium vulgare]